MTMIACRLRRRREYRTTLPADFSEELELLPGGRKARADSACRGEEVPAAVKQYNTRHAQAKRIRQLAGQPRR